MPTSRHAIFRTLWWSSNLLLAPVFAALIYSYVCGTATNAFLNLARSSDLRVRRLLLLTPDHRTKHVVAEVLVGDRWIVVDPTFRVIMKDANGRYLTRQDLRNPAIFAEVVNAVPNCPPKYDFENFAHVRLARLPPDGFHLRGLFDRVYPGWDEVIDWSLLLERESFFYAVRARAAFLSAPEIKE